MPRHKKSCSPDLPDHYIQDRGAKCDARSSSRDVSPTITTKIRQTSRGLVCQFTMNGQTIWEEELVSTTGQPITCLKDLPGDFIGKAKSLDIDDTQNRHEGMRAVNPGSRGNNLQGEDHRKPSAAHQAQQTSFIFSATPLQPSFFPKQYQPSQNNNNSSPLAPDTGENRQLSVSRPSSRSLHSIAEAKPAPATDNTPATLTVPKAKRLEMSFRQLLRRTTTYGRHEDRGRREHRDHREADHSHRSHDHHDDHGHHHNGGRSGRDSRRHGEPEERSLRQRYRAQQRHERDRRPYPEVSISFDDEFFCYSCGRLRSIAFRSKYPLQPGQRPKANFCLKCRFNAEEDGKPLSFRGLRYYCYGCGILRSVNFHDHNRPLGRDEMCPPNYCNRCRETSNSWDDRIILQSEVAPSARQVDSPGRRDDLHEIEEEEEVDSVHDSRSSEEIEPSPRDLRGMYHNADLLESQDAPEPEPVRVNETVTRNSSGTHRGPTVESEVDSQPELRAAQRARESQVNNDNAQSMSTPTSQGVPTPETGNGSPGQPGQNPDQNHATDPETSTSSRDRHPRDVGTQTDNIPTPPVMRGRAPSSSKSVHWPSDEEISTSQEYEAAGPSERTGTFSHAFESEHQHTVGPGRFAQARHSRRDPGAVSNGSPAERYDTQTRGNTGGPGNRQYDRRDAFADHDDHLSNGTFMHNGNTYTSTFTQGHEHDDTDLPSPSATLTGMPIPIHLLNPGFYNGAAPQAHTAHAPRPSQARSQGINSQMPDRGVPNFSMPMNTRDYEHSRNLGPSPTDWPSAHENAQSNQSSFFMRNHDDEVPVPDVSTTCVCDFDAVFKDMPKPDMNDEFYGHQPTDSDLEAMTRYAKSVVDGIAAAHGRLNEDTQDNNVASGSSSDQNHMNDEERSTFQSTDNYSFPPVADHFHSSMSSALHNQGQGRHHGGRAAQTYAATY